VRPAAPVCALVALLAVLSVACPRGGGPVAEPAPVELEWPDAATPSGREAQGSPAPVAGPKDQGLEATPDPNDAGPMSR